MLQSNTNKIVSSVNYPILMMTSLTYLIPTTPIPAYQSSRVHTVGIALDGAELSVLAPVNAILGSYTIAAFDDCGGHTNAHQGYHCHSTTGCTDKQATTTSDGHAPLIGYASDGYGIYAMRNSEGKEESLDECRGITDDTRGYHYHAASPSENMFIGCMHGETVIPLARQQESHTRCEAVHQKVVSLLETDIRQKESNRSASIHAHFSVAKAFTSRNSHLSVDVNSKLFPGSFRPSQ
ncbi:YHYH protein [Paucibacter sp. O1-1]|nr:YHYH protein [Paucibacter sp. O1-1]MDA3826155.1 YHYH protein [Paucibacter sp. O1-1]